MRKSQNPSRLGPAIESSVPQFQKVMRIRFIHLILAVSLGVLGSAMVHGQPGRREPATARPAIDGSNTKSRKQRRPAKARKAKAPETANVVINASPSDTMLLMNGQQVEGPVFSGLKPGVYVLTARRVGYNEESRSITLIPGENVPISITLEPVRGRLSVTPNVSGAEITVKKVGADDSQSLRTFSNSVADLNLAPGEYEISISREGYRGVKRTITLEPAGSVYLEPQLSRWPKERNPERPTPTIMQTSPAGKYVFVSLYGGSQDVALSGTLDVVVNQRSPAASRVSGLLPGFPCRVDFTPIDNVGDYLFTEQPAASNNWKRVAVKVRPNNKLPLHFRINWVSLVESDPAAGRVQESVNPNKNSPFEPATVRKRILPSYPLTARTLRINGVVLVAVEIDENGKVVSATATEGPVTLRRSAEDAAKQSEFSPAKRNGVAVRASQQLVFNFSFSSWMCRASFTHGQLCPYSRR
jgi:TonB family protein